MKPYGCRWLSMSAERKLDVAPLLYIIRGACSDATVFDRDGSKNGAFDVFWIEYGSGGRAGVAVFCCCCAIALYASKFALSRRDNRQNIKQHNRDDETAQRTDANANPSSQSKASNLNQKSMLEIIASRGSISHTGATPNKSETVSVLTGEVALVDATVELLLIVVGGTGVGMGVGISVSRAVSFTVAMVCVGYGVGEGVGGIGVGFGVCQT
jgi:hypothetical protein